MHARMRMQAFNALRVLLEQLYLERCSSSCTTDGVRVDATSQFVHVGRAPPCPSAPPCSTLPTFRFTSPCRTGHVHVGLEAPAVHIE